MAKKRLLFYFICNFLIFVSLSFVNAQLIPFIKFIGYSGIQQGVLLAGCAVVAIAGQFLFGYLCDRFHMIKNFFLLGFFFYIAAATGMLWVDNALFLYHFILISFSGGMVKVLMGLNETWMLEADAAHYGILRAGGALGLSVGSILIGYLVLSISYQDLKWYLLIIGIINGVLLFFCKDVKKEKRGCLKEDIRNLIQNHQYLLLVITLLFIYIVGTADQYTVVDKLLTIGGNARDVGWKWCIQSFAEIPIFFAGNWLVKKVSPIKLLMFGIVMYSIKFFFYAFFDTPLLLIGCSILQLVTLPIILLASKFLIVELSDQRVASSAQMFAMAIYIGVSALFTPLIASWLVESVGQDVTIYMFAGLCLIPFILSVVLRKNVESTHK